MQETRRSYRKSGAERPEDQRSPSGSTAGGGTVASREDLLALVEQSPQLGVLVHRNQKVIFANETYARILGYSRGELELVRSTDKLAAPHEYERLRTYRTKRMLGEPAPERYEFQAKRKDGSLVWVEAFVRVVKWDGEPAIVSTIVDISERKRTEEQLRQSEQRLRDLIEGSIEGIMIRDAVGVQYANQTFADLFGLTPAELHDADLMEALVAPHERERLRGYLATRLGGGVAPTRYVFEGRHRSGRAVWVESSVRPVLWGGSPAVQVTSIDVTARKVAEESLRQSENRYRDLVEGSIQAIAVMSKDMRLRFVNEAAVSLFGFSSVDELLAIGHVPDFVAPEDRERIAGYARARMRGEDVPEVYEFRGIRRDGKPVWVENRVRIVDWDGERSFLATMFDVTEQKRAAEQLAESEKRFRNLVEGSLQGTVIMDFDWRVRFANDAAARIFGYADKDDFIALGDASHVVHPDDIERVRSYTLARARGDNAPQEYDFLGIRKDGSPVWVQIIVRIVDWDGARLVQSTLIDISGRKQAERQAAEAQRFISNVVDTIPAVVTVKDARSRYVMVNRYFCDYWELKPDDLIGQGTRRALKDRASVKTVVHEDEQVFTSGETSPFKEIVLKKDGSPRIWWQTKVPLTDSEGVPRHVLTVAFDITERKQIEDDLRASEARYRQLIEQSPDAILIHRNRIIVFANKAAIDLLGARHIREVTGRSVMEFVHPSWRRFVRRRHSDIAAHRGAVGAMEQQFLTTTGEAIDVEVSGSFVAWEGKSAIQVIARDVTERKVIERALRFTQFAVERASDAAFWTDTSGRVVYANLAAERLLGHAREDLLKLSAWDVNADIPEKMWPAVLSRIKRTARGVSGIQRRLKRKDGSLVIAEISATYLEFAGQAYVFSFARDVSRRYQAEEALRLTQYSVDNAADAIFWIKEDGTFDYINKAAARMLGYSRSQLKKMSVFDIDDSMKGSRWRDQFRLVERTGVMTGEFVFKTRSGKRVRVDITDNFVQYGSKRYLFSFARDITARKQAEAALRERDEQLQNLTANIPGSVFQRILEPDGDLRFTYVSPGARDVWGLDPQAIVNDAEEFYNAIHPEDRDKLDRAVRESAAQMTPIDMELRAFDGSGALRWIRTRSRPRRLESGAIVWDGVSIDETERKHAEEKIREHAAQLAHALRVTTMGEMATALAHQLGQPLNAIANYTRGSLRRIKDGKTKPIDVVDALEQVSDQAERAGRIVRDIAEFIRKSEPQRDLIDINTVVDSAVSLARGEAEDAGVRVTLRLGRKLPKVRLDAIQIEQVLLNLMRNAIDAMSETWSGRRQLIVQSRRIGGELRVDVRDSGPPIDPRKIDQMFEPFQTSKSGGMGMGLAIARTIIEAHEGKLWATANSGRGMTFSFSLPLDQAEEEDGRIH